MYIFIFPLGKIGRCHVTSTILAVFCTADTLTGGDGAEMFFKTSIAMKLMNRLT